MDVIVRIQSRVIGMSTFHPNCMNWSWLNRGSVPRSHTKTKMPMTHLAVNQRIGHQPWLASCHSEIGHGARQPPRNSVAARAETVTMFMYSARKNIANLNDEYSVWNPPTS